MQLVVAERQVELVHLVTFLSLVDLNDVYKFYENNDPSSNQSDGKLWRL